MRPERVALLSCETRVPRNQDSVLDLLSGIVRRSYVASGLMTLSVGSWLEHPFYVHHNNSNLVISRRSQDGEGNVVAVAAGGQGLEPVAPRRGVGVCVCGAVLFCSVLVWSGLVWSGGVSGTLVCCVNPNPKDGGSLPRLESLLAASWSGW